jgi:hypothetical protein
MCSFRHFPWSATILRALKHRRMQRLDNILNPQLLAKGEKRKNMTSVKEVVANTEYF